MSEPKPARPTQVVVAGWLVVAGSVIVVLTAFSRVAGLHSLETRESIESYLASTPGSSLGLTVSGVQTILRIASMVAAACAAASAILGWQVLQRSRGARVGLSVLAAPLFVAGLVSGGVPSAVVTAAIVMLWFQPARDWFDGVSRPAPAPAASPAPRVATPPAVGADPLRDLPPPTAPPLYPTAYAAAPTRSVDDAAVRPAAVTWACVLTWLGAVATFGLMAALVLALVADPGLVADARSQNPDLADAGLSNAFLRNALYVTAVVAMAWSAAAVAFAVLVWRRVRWAAAALAVSAGAAGLLCLLTVIGSLGFVAPLAVCAATLALLLRPESRGWLRR